MMRFFVFVFAMVFVSCGRTDRMKMHADSIEKQLIRLPVAEKELQMLVDSSKWIFKARLIEAGVFFTWDFGTSEGTHRLFIDSCYKGTDTGFVDVHQVLRDDHKTKSGKVIVPGNEFILFLNAVKFPPPIPPPLDSTGDSISFSNSYHYAKIYELTSDTMGMIPWNTDIEIRIGQIIKAKQKY